MSVIRNTYYFFLITLVIMIIIWARRRRHTTGWQLPGKWLKYWGIATIVLWLTTGVGGLIFKEPSEQKSSASDQSEKVATSSTTSQKTAASQSAVPSSAKASSKSDDANDLLQAMDSTKLATFNQGLRDSLAEDQQFAQQGKDGYEYATYIDNINYSQQTGLMVTVVDDFANLTDDSKTVVGQGAQKSAAAQLVMMGEDLGADSTAIRTNIHYNGRQIGHSKAFNTSEFKWR
ncbi:hypothetical protein KBP51_08865 [Lactiplantibacillus pentosus]|uniref:hypothetical protein n=1 Tax=Lactiplantibacillus pentosus TaxID=1589 RepID=UPI00133004D5|nr:hypothetical protein [Lactiplantibacillus pentosus]MBQ0836556.1 hypothetical protein [Lactiplantibacillus pentosus]